MTMSTYNGWKNYETWAAKLWIDNDQYTQETAYEIVRTTTPDHYAAECLRDWFEEDAPDLGGTVWGDMLTAALSEIDWHEIADAIREDLEELED